MKCSYVPFFKCIYLFLPALRYAAAGRSSLALHRLVKVPFPIQVEHGLQKRRIQISNVISNSALIRIIHSIVTEILRGYLNLCITSYFTASYPYLNLGHPKLEDNKLSIISVTQQPAQLLNLLNVTLYKYKCRSLSSVPRSVRTHMKRFVIETCHVISVSLSRHLSFLQLVM